MRSLYTYDIPGANPTIRYYQKSLIRYRHLEQIDRFGNKQRRIIDWHDPYQKHEEPIDNQQFPLKVTQYNPKIGELSQSTILPSKSNPIITGKITNHQQPMSRSSVLSQSGLNSLSQKDLDQSPYFPHKYRDYDRDYPNKWTGMRSWEGGDPKTVIRLPSVDDQYFPKWP